MVLIPIENLNDVPVDVTDEQMIVRMADDIMVVENGKSWHSEPVFSRLFITAPGPGA
jgi:hypothetical protein